MGLSQKALEVIEFISMHEMNNCETENERLWAMVYEFAHVGGERCSNPHEDWEDTLLRTWEEYCGPNPPGTSEFMRLIVGNSYNGSTPDFDSDGGSSILSFPAMVSVADR